MWLSDVGSLLRNQDGCEKFQILKKRRVVIFMTELFDRVDLPLFAKLSSITLNYFSLKLFLMGGGSY